MDEEVAAVSNYMALGRLLNALGKFLNHSLPLLPIYEIGLKVILFEHCLVHRKYQINVRGQSEYFLEKAGGASEQVWKD